MHAEHYAADSTNLSLLVLTQLFTKNPRKKSRRTVIMPHCVVVFGSYVDIRKNAEWLRFFGPPSLYNYCFFGPPDHFVAFSVDHLSLIPIYEYDMAESDGVVCDGCLVLFCDKLFTASTAANGS